MELEELREKIPAIRPLIDSEQLIVSMLEEIYEGDPTVHIHVEPSLDTSAVFSDEQQILIMVSTGVSRKATSNLSANRWRFTATFTVITLDADLTFSTCASLAERMLAYPFTQSGENPAGRVAEVGEIAFQRIASSNQMMGKALKERAADVKFVCVDSTPL